MFVIQNRDGRYFDASKRGKDAWVASPGDACQLAREVDAENLRKHLFGGSPRGKVVKLAKEPPKKK